MKNSRIFPAQKKGLWTKRGKDKFHILNETTRTWALSPAALPKMWGLPSLPQKNPPEMRSGPPSVPGQGASDRHGGSGLCLHPGALPSRGGHALAEGARWTFTWPLFALRGPFPSEQVKYLHPGDAKEKPSYHRPGPQGRGF